MHVNMMTIMTTTTIIIMKCVTVTVEVDQPGMVTNKAMEGPQSVQAFRNSQGIVLR